MTHANKYKYKCKISYKISSLVLKLLKKIMLCFIVIIMNINFSFCSFDSSNFPNGNNDNNIIVVVFGVIIFVSLIIINYSYKNPPPPPAPNTTTFIELLPSIEPIEPINEQIFEPSGLSFIISRLLHNNNFENLGIVVLSIISVCFFFFGITVLVTQIYRMIVNSFPRDQLFNRVQQILDTIRQNNNERRRRDDIIMRNQYVLEYYIGIKNRNGFLTPEELISLNSFINTNYLHPLQVRILNYLNNNI